MADRITKRAVDALPSETRLWDGEIKGFGIQCTKAGTKSYVLKYRFRGRQRWYTIGKHGNPWTPEMARREAKRLLALIDEGTDPAAQKEQSRRAETFAEFADRYLQQHSEKHKKPGSVRDDRSYLRNHLLPVFGARKLADIDRQDVARLHHKLDETPSTANRVLALLSHIFTTA